MFEKEVITHHIDRHIMGVLMRTKQARFRDMRPDNTDTNLYSYHLKTMLRDGWIEKTNGGYTLSEKGMVYVDRVSTDAMRLRTQPKIITMLLVQDGYGKVLLQKRKKQPFIDTWTLPNGKIHIDDASVLAAGQREAKEKLGFDAHKLRHVGDCYIRVVDGERAVITTLVHVVRFETDAITATDDLQWVEPLDLAKLPLAPAVEDIVTRAFFGDAFFFEEFSVARA